MAQPTPGQVAYEAYWQRHYALRDPRMRYHQLVPWTKVMPKTRQCWEAAAQAARAAGEERAPH
jgi:hypothetical protein